MNGDSFRRSPATLAIAGITALISLIVTLVGGEDWAAVNAGFIPARITLGDAADGVLLVPAWLTPLTATLIHGGFFHLAMNLLLLVYSGVAAERALGARGIVALYVVGAYAAALAQALPDPQSVVPMIGASGAASAILGAYALLYGRSRAKPIGPIPAPVVNALWLAVTWSVLNLLIAAVAANTGLGIAAAAHIGGFIAGLILMRPLFAWRWRHA